MKFLDEYRDASLARQLIAEIRRQVSQCWTIMEVCGGQTHSLLRHGIDAELTGAVELIHGPGCPVCVTSLEAIDFAQHLSAQPGIVLTSFGDMLRVPGSRRSLLEVRALGGSVRPVYSPLDAVKFAQQNPRQQVVFFAVGFETTAPATALAVRQAAALGLNNFSLLVAHVRVLPAMEAIASSPNNRVQAFLAAGHVCTIAGYQQYQPFVRQYRLPVVVTGFEPVDLLFGICQCIRQLELGVSQVANCYGRTVQKQGNLTAQELIASVFEVCDCTWRGLGTIANGGFRLHQRWQRFDAERRFGRNSLPVLDASECQSGDVLAGRIKPTACPSFGATCTPDHPLGAPMVSSEGACAAYFQYAEASNGARKANL